MSQEYDYPALYAAATAPAATQEDINALGEWCERYGMSFWNGLAWVLDDHRDEYLTQVYRLDPNADENEEVYPVGYAFSREPIFLEV